MISLEKSPEGQKATLLSAVRSDFDVQMRSDQNVNPFILARVYYSE